MSRHGNPFLERYNAPQAPPVGLPDQCCWRVLGLAVFWGVDVVLAVVTQRSLWRLCRLFGNILDYK
jgi:hypothetical protein